MATRVKICAGICALALSDDIVDDLAGLITATDYPEGGEGRIGRLG